MAELEEVMAYICAKYPIKYELSKARLTKMIYLADWKSVLDRGEQLTEIRWRFHHYGPWSDKVVAVARSSRRFRIEATENYYGGAKEVVAADPELETPRLTPDEVETIDHVIDATRTLYWEDFIKLVYSTYPIVASHRYVDLDLKQLAANYRRELASLDDAGSSGRGAV